MTVSSNVKIAYTAGHLERVANLDATATTLSSFAYDFDGLGRRTSVVDQQGQVSNWSYDGAGQLGGDFYFTSSGGWATLTLGGPTSPCRTGRVAQPQDGLSSGHD